MGASWVEESSEHWCHSPRRLYYLQTETLVHYPPALPFFPPSRYLRSVGTERSLLRPGILLYFKAAALVLDHSTVSR